MPQKTHTHNINILRTLTDSSFELVSLLSEKGEIIFQNSNSEKTLGYKAAETDSEDFFNFVHPDDKEMAVNEFNNILLNPERLKPVKFRFTHKNGNFVWAETQGQNLLSDPNFRGVLFRSRALTVELKQPEAKQLFLHFAENAQDVFYRITLPEGKYEYISPASNSMFGYSPEEFYSNRLLVSAIIHPDFIDCLKTEWQKLSEGQISPFYEFKIITKIGEIKWVRIRNVLIKADDNTPIAIEGIVSDITEYKKTINALQKNEQKLVEIFDSTPDAVILHDDKSGKVIDCNQAAVKMYGYETKEEMLNISIKDVSSENHGFDQEKINKKIQRANKNEIYTFEWIAKKKNGECFWEEVSLKKTPIAGKGVILAVTRDISKRKKAEIALKESEEKIRLLGDNIPKGQIFQLKVTPEGESRFTYISKKVEELHECTAEEAIANPALMFDRVLPEDRAALQAVTEKSIQKLSVYDHKVRIQRKSGEIRWHRMISRPRKLPDGDIIFDGIDFDITDTVKAEQALKNSLIDLKLAQTIAKIGNWKFDPYTGKFEWSDHIYDIYERDQKKEPFRIDDYKKIYKPDQYKIFISAFQKSIDRGIPYNMELKLHTTSGKIKWVHAICLPYKEKTNGKYFLRGTIQDITSRKEAEQALKISEQKYKSLFDFSQDAIVLTTIDGDILNVNQTAKDLLELNESQDIKKYNAADFYVNPKDRIELLKAFKERGFIKSFQAKLKSSSGRIINTLGSSCLINLNNQTPFLLSSLKDISLLKEAEAKINQYALELEEANATKDKFFSIIAHDLKNPFNAIIGFSGMAINSLQNQSYDEVLEFCEIINTAAVQNLNLLNNLLYWSRLQTGGISFSPQALNFNSLLENTISLLRVNIDKKHIGLSFKMPDNFIITADKFMLSTILRNLLSNAVKFTNEKGHISIRAEKRKHVVQISVKDTGVGIEKADINKLFKIESNFSTRGTQDEKGSGLGLVLCKEFTEKHGGKIWAESTPGEGTTFSFTLSTELPNE